jgi:ADP-dependent NAD(P)H-hydrate dehydratase
VGEARSDEPRGVTPRLLRGMPLPEPGGDKEAKGRLLVVGGSTTTPGAVVLAAEAALRVGAGKVQVATTGTTAGHVATRVPEAFVLGLDTEGDEIAPGAADRLLELAEGADAVLLGPGIGNPDAACALLERLVPHCTSPLTVDALGTAYLTDHPDGLRHLDGRAVVTPNLSEISRLLGEDEGHCATDVLAATRRAAGMTGATVVSGADVSYVVEPSGDALALDLGAPGAAVAGSGDVKAGAVAGLLARGAAPVVAAAWATYVHARAGERLTASVGRVGFLARELVVELPAALGEVEA